MFLKLHASLYCTFVEVRLRDVWMCRYQNCGGDTLLSVGGVHLKFRKTGFQLFVMHVVMHMCVCVCVDNPPTPVDFS